MSTLLTRLPRPRDVSGRFGVYVHVPFCSHRCWYCDFNAYAGLEHLAEAYMQALVRDIREGLSAPAEADLTDRPTVTSVFIGGGTPSLVSAVSIAAVLDALRDSWPLDEGAEITIECNPESLDRSKLDTYLRAGINRVSIGVQSLDASVLARLGRMHSAEKALTALELASSCGFTNISADLIFGSPGEDEDAWRSSVSGVLSRCPSHVSCYALIYEEGTPLDSWRKLGKVVPVTDDAVAARWEIAEALLAREGFARYEVSNWARPGAESDHNGLYWACGEYIGVGAGAHSHLATANGAARSWTVRSPERYISAVREGLRPVAGSESIDHRTRAAEVMILGLRRTAGVSLEEFEAVVGAPLEDLYSDELRLGLHRGVIEVRDGRVRASRPMLLNEATVLFA